MCIVCVLSSHSKNGNNLHSEIEYDDKMSIRFEFWSRDDIQANDNNNRLQTPIFLLISYVYGLCDVTFGSVANDYSGYTIARD